MKFNVCTVCVIVSGTWLALSFAVAFGYLSSAVFVLPIAILMGGTVVGLAYQGEKVNNWAQRHFILWKLAVMLTGFSVVYLAVANLSRLMVLLEFVLMVLVAILLFRDKSAEQSNQRAIGLEEKLKKCC